MKRRSRRVALTSTDAGESTAYWEAEWAAVDLAAAHLGHVVNPDATMRLLEEFVPTEGVVLEAGSGASTYLSALRAPGRTLVGVDLAGRALRASADAWPDLHLVEGDVRTMPLRDRSVDCVISLGVVEHIEAGPGEALREHRRVLRDDGIGLISVPTLNGIRWLKDRWHIDVRRRESYLARGRLVSTVAEPAVTSGEGSFHQYEFQRRAWHRALDEAGFAVVADHHYMVHAGLGELPALARRPRGETSARSSEERRSTASNAAPAPRRGDELRRVLIRELPVGPVERLACSASQRMFGHMLMTVVRPR